MLCLWHKNLNYALKSGIMQKNVSDLLSGGQLARLFYCLSSNRKRHMIIVSLMSRAKTVLLEEIDKLGDDFKR